MPKPIHESGAAVAATPTSTGLLEVEFITPGWGSSGYYSPAVIESAAPLFAVGTHLYFDHPTAEDHASRPERSVRDLAAVIVEAGQVSSDTGGVRGVVRPLAPYRDLLTDEAFAENVGLSIRGSATDVVEGEAEGRRGPIIEGLARIDSVDFVTRAGRGGRVLQVLESARPLEEARNVGQWVESHIHRDFTILADDMAAQGRLTRDERIQLSSAIGDALAAFVENLETNAAQLYARDIWDDPGAPAVARAVETIAQSPASRAALTARAQARGVAEATADERREQLANVVRSTHGGEDRYAWVRDFDDATVWFETYADDEASQLWQQAYTVADDDLSTFLTGTRTKVRAVTRYVPVNPAGQSTTQESEEDTMPNIEESRLRELEEAHGRVPTLESERDTAIRERDEAVGRLASRDRIDRARAVIAERATTHEVTFTALEQRGLLAGLPQTQEGALDEEAFTATVDEAAAEKKPKGGVRGFGGSGPAVGESTTRTSMDDIDRALGLKEA